MKLAGQWCRRLSALSLVACLALAACAPQASSTLAQARPSTAPGGVTALGSGPIVYVAIGASETVGVGTRDSLRQAWPQLFFNATLPPRAVLYNFAFPGATTAEALDQEVPPAVALHPTLVTVWLNANDLFAGIPAGTYEDQLRRVVQAFRDAGVRRILIANTPYLDRLPAILACATPADSAVHCPIPGTVPDAAHLNALVDAYNGAIARVAAENGATVVDLHARGEVPDAHPEWVSADGLHPNAAGYAEIAMAFQAALLQPGP